MAVVKFVNARSPMNNIFDYVTRREATESKLISGVNCSPESALDEFRFVKKRFHKEDGRSWSSTKEEFIEYMREHGYKVQWEDKYKYITFTTPEGYKVRDNKLFDERFLKNNLELYFAMGGCDGEMLDTYCDYVTPYHDDSYTMTSSDGLFNLLGDILSSVPADYYYQPHYIKEMNTIEKLRLEKILGRKISNEAFRTYCTREDYGRRQGIAQTY